MVQIARANKKLIKSQVKNLVVAYPKTTQTHIARTFGISRVTAKKWLEEIRDEQIQRIEAETRRAELWRLGEKGKEYVKLLMLLRADVKHFYYKFPHVILGIVKAQWQIEKEIYQLKLDLYSRELSEREKQKIRTIDQKIGIATVVNVKGG
ncbi:hypothetical protein ACFLZP_01640 [Patescibacteria group bacterium]